jgi:hypothetical protein
VSLDSALDRKLSGRARAVVLGLACLVPTVYVLRQYDAETQFTKLILFGQHFMQRALPQVRALRPANETRFGYDGQFYAQLALDPLLKDPRLGPALDSAPYRSRKILLPAVAYLLGLGKPVWVLSAYALLNLVFWFLLLFGMVRWLRVETPRGLLCVFATLFSTGALFSLERSLSDLPAATFGFFAAALTGAAASTAIALSLLTRDTSALFFARDAWPLPTTRATAAKLALRTTLALAPVVLWRLYVARVFGDMPTLGVGFLGAPFGGAWAYLSAGVRDLRATPFSLTFAHPSQWEARLFVVLGGVSVAVQGLSLLVWRKPDCAYWRIGAAVALAMVFFSAHIYEEYAVLCRVALSLTLAFNIGLMQRRGGAFVFAFVAGNLGTLWELRNVLGAVLALSSPAQPQRGVVNAVSVPGTFQSKAGCPGDWLPECPATHMTRGPDGLWRLTVALPAGDYEYKISVNDSWAENYGEGGEWHGENVKLRLAEPAGAVTFTYDALTHQSKAQPAVSPGP